MPRRSGMRSAEATLAPWTRTSPDVGRTRPLTVRSKVVLPLPLRPRMAVMEAPATVSEMLSSRRRPSGVAKVRLRNSMAAGMRLKEQANRRGGDGTICAEGHHRPTCGAMDCAGPENPRNRRPGGRRHNCDSYLQDLFWAETTKKVMLAGARLAEPAGVDEPLRVGNASLSPSLSTTPLSSNCLSLWLCAVSV